MTIIPNAGTSPHSILLIAGDVSGDVHAAALARTLLAHDPSRRIHALGGKRLRDVVAQSSGGTFLADSTNSSAIGLIPAIRIYFHCLGLRDRVLDFVDHHRVDLAILCDWGGFNGRMITYLHARGIRVLYYFPPGSWQRTGERALGIVPYVTRVATPFAWSAERLRAAGARADWVGHPALEQAERPGERTAARSKFALAPNELLVALFPGSRPSEVRVLAPRMAGTAQIVKAQMPAKFVAAVPRELQEEARRRFPSSVEVVTDCARELLLAADAAVIKTGTGTLEAVFAGTPQVAVYDLSTIGRIEWFVLWSWRWVPFIAMPNIILQREAVPELIGLQCQPKKIARALLRLLTDADAREKMRRDYALIAQALGSELPILPTERTAQIVEEMLHEMSAGTGARSAVA